jgi:tetraacyldisaccharide 4'-kinase
VRRWFEGLETFAIDVILDRRYGHRADALRWILHALSWLYLAIVGIRLSLYRRRALRSRPMGCPVISVGNLTVGGTGKTPVVEMLARALQAGGRRVAILSRGYKSRPKPLLRRIWDKVTGRNELFAPRVVSDGISLLLDSREAGDEPFMLASNLRGVVVLVDRDRVKSGHHAVRHFGSDALILDDGFQYLRMRHAIEIALIDRQAPFGNNYLLPRGTLREPPHHLRRATHIFLTKCDHSNHSELITRIRKFNRTAPIIECHHKPVLLRNFTNGQTEPLTLLRDMNVGALSGIAMPGSFESALESLGASVMLRKAYTDHHRYSVHEIESFIRRCAKRSLHAVLTTEKDAVRIPRIREPEIPIYYLRVEIEILRGHNAYQDLINRLTHTSPALPPSLFAEAC